MEGILVATAARFTMLLSEQEARRTPTPVTPMASRREHREGSDGTQVDDLVVLAVANTMRLLAVSRVPFVREARSCQTCFEPTPCALDRGPPPLHGLNLQPSAKF